MELSTKLTDHLVVCAVVAVYLISGGRLSIGISVAVLYALAIHDSGRKVEVSEAGIIQAKSGVAGKPEKKTCCGGKGGSSCCSSGSGGKKGGCCGGSCASKKRAEEKPASTGPVFESSASEPIAIDFTHAFKPARSSKPKSGAKKMPRFISRTAGSAKKDTGFFKKALTVSNEKLSNSQIYVFYSSLQGAAERSAKTVLETLSGMPELKYEPKLLNLDELSDFDDYFVNVPCSYALYILVLPSYDSDSPLDFFLQSLQENASDFRIDKYVLRKLVGYAVLGIGDSESWPEKFCYQARQADLLLAKQGGRRVFPVGEICMKFGGDPKVSEWSKLLAETLCDDEPILYEYDETLDDEEPQDPEDELTKEPLIDLEDVGKSSELQDVSSVKKMIVKDSPTFKNLTKQGYTVVGSHSGVKICRWTKNDLRGRGSCYKHSLFNIVSSRCMELTPSLACSSKCIFCWRHGTNPVSKTWRWEVDDPEYILENALQGHYAKIKQMRGVPGVIAERFAKAFKVRHCALSLVGEPIMYPFISKFVSLLHQKEISSFLVCNAQHPEPLRDLGKVTQLYVSIDAPTKNELKKVDRPLYRDFWERLMECLDILRTTQSHQRTVFRMTLVKGFNMADVSAYADLVQRGLPCFIEVKGATFCGTSDGNGNPLTMQNIPFYEECAKFVKSLAAELQRRGLGYDVAAEHAHSNCILIASTKFKINNEWYTHIDFDRFFELLNSGKDFNHMEYLQKTPEWALFGNGGFAPGNTRFYKKKRGQEAQAKEEQGLQENVSTQPINA
ncbi:putative tRNA 4-demethylwyosine synthase [Lachancea thermotolerans CBS 6340]|uniref:S-adenosyl-L-methionine-dependent tRNA 4-demethylwyosine synthase n=1 Tax=Lachancea thermotolerans (strain ATCC 56472 / CBS 6340 / NRRL Y-8284) TaxID=559295 RepID=C5E2D4_LACTC|nr:KLTH0H04026p [Lachancea thermotolerans CBS 6340]CAR30195.1 KLTH0H04026p [Lachancea thermotolerans CBS 6340]